MKNERFADLKKVPKQPAARLLALSNAKLKTPLKSPASASVSEVLAELEQSAPDVTALVDMLRLLSVALPARERAWWACMAARDVIGADAPEVPLPLAAAEKWVRKPSDDNRDATRVASEVADPDDPTELCAMTVIFCDEKLGTGDLAQYDAPAGAAQNAAFGMNIHGLDKIEGGLEVAANLFIDRAVDIARGGNGNVAPTPAKEPAS